MAEDMRCQITYLTGVKVLEPVKYKVVERDGEFAVESDFAVLSGFKTHSEAIMAKWLCEHA